MKSILFALSLVLMGTSHAAIVCEATIEGTENAIKVTIDDSTVTVDHTTAPSKVYRNVRSEWDGHMSGMYTAPGIAVKYENHYNCITDVVVITDVDPTYRSIQAIEIASCRNTEFPSCDQ